MGYIDNRYKSISSSKERKDRSRAGPLALVSSRGIAQTIKKGKAVTEMATVGSDAPAIVLKSVFKKYDKDNSGTINSSELKELCYDLGYYLNADEIHTTLQILDKDGGGNIDFGEFLQFWRDNSKFQKLESAKGERIKQAITYFRYFDTDKSGSLTADEYVQLHGDLIKNKLIPGNITADEGLKQLDRTGDKKVSFNEFIAYMDSVQ